MNMGEFIEMCVADGMSIQDAEDVWFEEMRTDWDAYDTWDYEIDSGY